MKLAATILAITLSGCAYFGGPQAQQKSIITACNAYASALTTAAQFRSAGKLSQSQVETVNEVIPVVSPLCNADSLPNRQQALRKIQRGVSTLGTVNSQVSQ